MAPAAGLLRTNKTPHPRPLHTHTQQASPGNRPKPETLQPKPWYLTQQSPKPFKTKTLNSIQPYVIRSPKPTALTTRTHRQAFASIRFPLNAPWFLISEGSPHNRRALGLGFCHEQKHDTFNQVSSLWTSRTNRNVWFSGWLATLVLRCCDFDLVAVVGMSCQGLEFKVGYEIVVQPRYKSTL